MLNEMLEEVGDIKVLVSQMVAVLVGLPLLTATGYEAATAGFCVVCSRSDIFRDIPS